MAEGVERRAWDRAAILWAAQVNTFRGKGAPTYTPAMIHPYYPDKIPAATDSEPRIQLTTDNLNTWAEAYVKAHAKRK